MYEDAPDLSVGSYAALEGDVGVPVRTFMGFGLRPEELLDEVTVIESAGWSTAPGRVCWEVEL